MPGAIRASGAPIAAAWSSASISAAASLISSTRPSPSRPMTPAVTPLSTASMNSRRRSVSSCVRDQRVALGLELARHAVEDAESMAISSSPRSSLTRTSRSPAPTCSAAPARRPTGLASRSAKRRPSMIEARITSSAKPR